jgi:hypothetical protein
MSTKKHTVFRLVIAIASLCSALLEAHGFGGSTGVRADSGRCMPIEAITRGFDWVASYALDSDTVVLASVAAAGKATTNCYFRITLRRDVHEQCESQIVCTPSQLFYLPERAQWVPAVALEVGDALLGLAQRHEIIEYIEFVAQPREVYILEVANHHTFFVGCSHHAVLTHNMLAPVGIWVGISIAFGEGAAFGGSAGSFLGPITCAGGIIIGGVVGILAHSICKPRFTYEVDFNVAGIHTYKLHNHDPIYLDHNTWQYRLVPEEYAHSRSLYNPHIISPKPPTTNYAQPEPDDLVTIDYYDIRRNAAAYAERNTKKIPHYKGTNTCTSNTTGSFVPPDPHDDEKKKQHPHGKYEDAPYHHRNSNGKKSPAPQDGQAALDNSVQIKNNSPHRIGVSKGEIVILKRTAENLYHGYVVTLEELISDKGMIDAKNALIRAGLVNKTGKIIFNI